MVLDVLGTWYNVGPKVYLLAYEPIDYGTHQVSNQVSCRLGPELVGLPIKPSTEKGCVWLAILLPFHGFVQKQAAHVDTMVDHSVNSTMLEQLSVGKSEMPCPQMVGCFLFPFTAENNTTICFDN